MGGLLGQAHPHAVLLGPLRGEQGYHRHAHEEQYCSYLYIGIDGKAFQRERVVIAHVDIAIGMVFVEIDTDVVATRLEPRSHLRDIGGAVGIVAATSIHIAHRLHPPLLVEHDDGDGVVLVYHAQHQIEVGVLVGGVERAHSLCPHPHLVALLGFEVARQPMRHHHRGDSHQYGYHHQHYLYLSYAVCPFHIL